MAYAINKGVEITDRMITVQNLENVTRTFQRNVDIAVGGLQQVAQNAASPEVVDRIFTNFLSRVARNAENTMEEINYIAAGLANPNEPIAEAEFNRVS